MQRFIPFEDEWQALDGLDASALVPYHFGLPCAHALAANDARLDSSGHDQRTSPTSPSMVICSPTATPSFEAVPAGNSRT